MTTANTTATPAAQMPDLPAGLDRRGKPAPVAAAPASVAAAPAPQPDKSSKPLKTGKPAKAAKAVKTPHKKTAIKSTPDNPAKSIVPNKFKAAYAEHNDTCGRPLNLALKAYTDGVNADGRPCLDLDKLEQVAKANGIDFGAYKHLNNGQKRMNVGNKLAGLIKAGKTVTIGKQRFADAGKALAKPEGATTPKAKKAAKPAPVAAPAAQPAPAA